jgi:hypothetical protein
MSDLLVEIDLPETSDKMIAFEGSQMNDCLAADHTLSHDAWNEPDVFPFEELERVLVSRYDRPGTGRGVEHCQHASRSTDSNRAF